MIESEYLKPGERFDDLQRNNYKIIQHTGRFCFGMDAVLLSGFVRIKPKSRVLDMGTGTGIIPILLEAKTEGRQFVGLEIQEESADMARRSVEVNGLSDKIDIVVGDIKEAASIFGASSFEAVVTNPPYMINTHGLQNPTEEKAIARHEIKCTLEDVIREGSRVLKPSGRFFMVHRPYRLAEIFVVLKQYGLEPKRLKLVHPYVNREPSMVLIEACKGGKPSMIVEAPIIIYNEAGSYSDEITELYGY